MGEEADDIVVSFGLTSEQAKQYNTVEDKFENYFVERAKFNHRHGQIGNESVDSFITDLYCLAEYCEFGTLKDDIIRDRIVVRLKYKKLSERLQLGSKLTLEKAVTHARQSETVKKQQTFLQGSKSEAQSASVDRLFKARGKEPLEKGKRQRKPPKPKRATENISEAKCLDLPHPKKLCPARDSKCNKYAKVSHWAKACKSRPDKRVAEVKLTEDQYDDEFFLSEITEVYVIKNIKQTAATNIMIKRILLLT